MSASVAAGGATADTRCAMDVIGAAGAGGGTAAISGAGAGGGTNA